jgi:hypothetical protein
MHTSRITNHYYIVEHGSATEKETTERRGKTVAYDGKGEGEIGREGISKDGKREEKRARGKGQGEKGKSKKEREQGKGKGRGENG